MNPNATITDEQFKAYLKKVRDMVEGPYTEWQKEIEVTNTFPKKFYQSNIDNDIYRYSLPVEYGGWGLSEKEILQVQEPSAYNEDLTYAHVGRDISCNLGSLNIAKAMDGLRLRQSTCLCSRTRPSSPTSL